MAAVHGFPGAATPPHQHVVEPRAAPSPTLTNPDLILPYQDYESSLSVPIASSPTLSSHQIPSTPRRNGLNSHPPKSSPEIGVAKALALPFRPSHAAQTYVGGGYSGYEHGTALSVIGEEETTPKSKRGGGNEARAEADSTSPTRATARLSREINRLSSVSDSSLGAAFDVGRWDDVDGPAIINDRLKADLEAEETDDSLDLDGLDSKRNSGVAVGEDDMKRAERILANAKKRLTKMEDNLSKARTSILISPRMSPTMGEHQPAGGLYRSISLGGDRRYGLGTQPRKSKPFYPIVKSVQASHTRGSSETSVPSTLARISHIAEVRSASALDYMPEQSIDSTLSDRSPRDQEHGYSPGSNSTRSLNTPLKALQEEDVSEASSTKTSPDHQNPRGLGIMTHPNTMQDFSKNANPATSPVIGELPRRSMSQSSLRSAKELRDQMNGLKSRIVGLQSRARSQQSIRTPSPSAQAAEQWYAGAAEYKESDSPLSTNAGHGWNPNGSRNPPPNSPKDNAFGEGEIEPAETPVTRNLEARTDVNTPNLHGATSTQVINEAGSLVQASNYEDANEDFSDSEEPVAASEEEQIYLNEVLEESLQDSDPEVPVIPDEILALQDEPERHEDRIDAFDYENMFLHSALGNYSQAGLHRRNLSRESVESDGSEVSIETARAGLPDEPHMQEDPEEELVVVPQHSRAPLSINTNGYRGAVDDNLPTPKAPNPPWVHMRSQSVDSVSTNATFATATEGGRDSETESDTIPTEILNWGKNSPSPTLKTFRGFPNPPSGSPIFGVQSRSATMRGGSPLVVTATSREDLNARPPSRGKQLDQSSSHSPEPALPNRGSPAIRQSQFEQTPQPANTEVLMASLITLADPTFKYPPPGNPTTRAANTFADVDKNLVLALLRSVGAVCNNILTTDGRGDVYESRVWRRRLDAARRVLDGQVEIDEDDV